MPESMTNREMIISEALETIKKYHELNRELEATATRRLGLLRRCASHLSFILSDYSEFGAVYHPNVPEITDLINELAAELEGSDG
jgi:hypothetical protein